MNSARHSQADPVRLFVALAVNVAVRKNLAAEQVRLKRLVTGVQWRPPESFHLTLAFLGNIYSSQVEAIADVLDSATGASPAFDLEVAGMGSFGPSHCPSVLWAGVGRGMDQVAALAERIRAGLRSLGLPFDDRPFQPHVTLCRVTAPHAACGMAGVLIGRKPAFYGVLKVAEVQLMRSELSAQGHVYRSVTHRCLDGLGAPCSTSSLRTAIDPDFMRTRRCHE